MASFYVEPPPPFDEKDEKKEYEPSWVAEKKSNAKDSEYSDKAYDGGKYEYDPNADNNGYVWNNEAQEWVYQYPQQSQEETYNDYYNSEAEAPMNNYYFFNTFSGQSVWFEPVGWQELIMSEWNGWWLCREELTGIEYW